MKRMAQMRGTSMRLAAIACAATATVGLVVGPASAPSIADTTEANAVATQVNAVTVADPDSPQLNVVSSGSSIQATGDGIGISMPAAATGDIALTETASPTLVVGLPESLSVKSPAVASDQGTVVYGQQTADTAVAVQAFPDGVRVHTVLSSSSAPTTFTYPVDVPIGGSIAALDGSRIAVLDAAGDAVGFFDTPWAIDAANVQVPTTYEIVGSTVIQHVDHQIGGVTYPVVADPYLFKNLIKSAKWSYNSYYQGWTFEVTPTKWARWNGKTNVSLWVGKLGWRELYKRYKNHGLNTNLGGMRDQWICHQVIVSIADPNKKTWNLDEYRRNTTLAKTFSAQCNPAPP